LKETDDDHNGSKNEVDVPIPHQFEINLEKPPSERLFERFSLAFSLLILVLLRVERLVHSFLFIRNPSY